MPNSRRVAGLRVSHATRLPHAQIQARQPHGRPPRGSGARHPRDPFGFLHGRVRLQEDVRPVIGAGLGSGRDRPRLGALGHARARHPRCQKRQNARHHQAGEGHGRQVRPRGTQVRGGGPSRLRVADVTYVRMTNGSFGYTAFAADVFARRIVGWSCATTMDAGELPLHALSRRSRAPQ